MLYREAQYMQLFAHRCIPHLFGVKVDEKPLALIMEFRGKRQQITNNSQAFVFPLFQRPKI